MVIDPLGGTRSIQAAELTLTEAQLDAVFSTVGLERLARAYWRFLARITLGLIHVLYTETERLIVLVGRPLVLLSFDAPEYVLAGDRSLVRWRIRGGLLLARAGRPSRGWLQIGLRRLGPPGDGGVRVEVEVAVLDYVPSIARTFGERVYRATQSRIHVRVTHAFLRSLAHVDLTRPPAGPHRGG